jgi:hypothetical protein
MTSTQGTLGPISFYSWNEQPTARCNTKSCGESICHCSRKAALKTTVRFVVTGNPRDKATFESLLPFLRQATLTAVKAHYPSHTQSALNQMPAWQESVAAALGWHPSFASPSPSYHITFYEPLASWADLENKKSANPVSERITVYPSNADMRITPSLIQNTRVAQRASAGESSAARPVGSEGEGKERGQSFWEDASLF